MAQHLILTSLETEIYDTTPYCMAVNASVQNELLSRESAHKKLKSERNKESKSIIAAAFAACKSFIDSLKSSITDLISAASIVPAVVELDGKSVQADSTLELSAIDAETLQRQVEGMDTSALADSSLLQDLMLAAQSDFSLGGLSGDMNLDAWAGAGDLGLDGFDTGTLTDILNSDELQMAADYMGYGDYLEMAKNPDSISKMMDGGLEGLAVTALDTMLVSAVPAAALIPADMRKAMIKSALSTAMDMSKTLAAGATDKLTDQVGDGLLDGLNAGDFTDEQMFGMFENRDLMGDYLQDQIGGAVAGIPSNIPGNTDLFTGESIGFSAELKTFEKYAQHPGADINVVDDFIDDMDDHASLFDTNYLSTMVTTAPLTPKNLSAINQLNGGTMPGSIQLVQDPLTGSITAQGKSTVAGVAVLDEQTTEATGIFGKAMQSCKVITDPATVSKQLQTVHPVAQTIGTAVRDNAYNMSMYDRLSSTGTNLTRMCLGNDLNNRINSIRYNADYTRHTATRSINQFTRIGRGATATDIIGRATTSVSRNKHNLYGLMNFTI